MSLLAVCALPDGSRLALQLLPATTAAALLAHLVAVALPPPADAYTIETLVASPLGAEALTVAPLPDVPLGCLHQGDAPLQLTVRRRIAPSEASLARIEGCARQILLLAGAHPAMHAALSKESLAALVRECYDVFLASLSRIACADKTHSPTFVAETLGMRIAPVPCNPHRC